MEDTAMQQLLTKLKEYSHSGWLSLDEIEQEILDFGILVEKRLITKAFNQGYREGEEDGNLANPLMDISKFKDAENYYNRTYKSEA